MKIFILVLVSCVGLASSGSIDWRIIGGSKAKDGQFPYQISLRDDGQHICGGSILNEKWIITAAHCVDGTLATDLTVVTGTNQLDQGGDVYQVQTFIEHESYDTDDFHNDIALIKIQEKINFNDNVKPIAPNTEFVNENVELILSGWGSISFPDETTPNDLQFLKLKSITSDDCEKKHSNSNRHVDETQICTLSKIGEGACHGDSGGPLVYNGKLVGLDSWSKPCGIGYPDVFTRVSKYIDWINTTIINHS